MALIDDPEHLRMRAAERRGRADKAVYPETKQGLLRIADDYELLARRAEQRTAVLSRQAKGPVEAAADLAVGEKIAPEAAQDTTVSEFPLEPKDRSEKV
jgi:hypothetical protein